TEEPPQRAGLGGIERSLGFEQRLQALPAVPVPLVGPADCFGCRAGVAKEQPAAGADDDVGGVVLRELGALRQGGVRDATVRRASKAMPVEPAQVLEVRAHLSGGADDPVLVSAA